MHVWPCMGDIRNSIAYQTPQRQEEHPSHTINQQPLPFPRRGGPQHWLWETVAVARAKCLLWRIPSTLIMVKHGSGNDRLSL